VKCWGFNDFGQLGDGTKNDSSVPVDVQGVSGATSIAVGGHKSCAVVGGGAVKCWGDFGDVQGLSGAVEIACGYYHCCVRMGGGNVKCWGGNSYGALGDGTNTDNFTPVDVLNVSGAVHISAGRDYTCAIQPSGAQCWGDNAKGQLGDGTTTKSNVPVQVKGVP
jgi:alpha-tubulin suppressor-like RCC1 family protein